MSKIAQKSPIFPPPVYLTPPMKGLPLEFGIGVRCPECFYDGAIRRCKKFSDTFSRFDTIPAVTDSQPPSHPASHVAVAITLYAKASSLKISNCRNTVSSQRSKCLTALRNCWQQTILTMPSSSRSDVRDNELVNAPVFIRSIGQVSPNDNWNLLCSVTLFSC